MELPNRQSFNAGIQENNISKTNSPIKSGVSIEILVEDFKPVVTEQCDSEDQVILQNYRFFFGVFPKNNRISMKKTQRKILSKKFFLQLWCVNWEFDEGNKVGFSKETVWKLMKIKAVGIFGTLGPSACWWNIRGEWHFKQFLLDICWVFNWNPAERKEACSSEWIWIRKFLWTINIFTFGKTKDLEIWSKLPRVWFSKKSSCTF